MELTGSIGSVNSIERKTQKHRWFEDNALIFYENNRKDILANITDHFMSQLKCETLN